MATVDEIRPFLINGEWIETEQFLDVRAPYDGSIVARVAQATTEDARKAIDAASDAMATPLPAHHRAEILDRVAADIRERREEFARILALEAGKPITAALTEVDRAVQTFLFSASEARRLAGELVPMDAHPAGENKLGLVLRVPIGVIGAITPFNFPLNLVAHKIGPAFAAGCACVLKPARATPLSALHLAETFLASGQPPGWLNVIVGSGEQIGSLFAEDKRVKMITFTGSPEVGWKLRARAPEKKVLLELGNSTPMIILQDADLEAASDAIVAFGYGYSGQSCISVQRVYAEEAIHDRLVAALVEKVGALRVGDPLDPQTQVGPVIDKPNCQRILSTIEEAVKSGAAIETGGTLDDEGLILPTLLSDVTNDMKIASKEIFGPVVSITRVGGLTEAIELANATRYGLQAGIFTARIDAALDAAHALEFGGVTINEAAGYRSDQMPYGGVKDSGNTREGPRYAVDEMTERRMVVIQR
jgi:acyl-CoA reductase-like NAD-dependent aldehyde dehydrogenase